MPRGSLPISVSNNRPIFRRSINRIAGDRASHAVALAALRAAREIT
jgi:hypothetical protein